MRVFSSKKKLPTVMKSKFKTGLALSGGGTRGVAHIGVIKAFTENGISFDYVAGTSAGSLAGALYCAGISCEQMTETIKTVSRRDILNSRFVIGSKSENVEKLAEILLGDKTFDELFVPFTAVAVDISDGSEVELSSGKVATAVSASCAVPALFRPVKIDGKTLVDGGLLNNMPSDVCRRMGAEIVIGVDLHHNRGKGTASNKLLDTLIATWSITTKSTMYKGIMNSDVVIEPELDDYKNTRLDHIDEMIEEGYRAATEKMDEIKEILEINC